MNLGDRSTRNIPRYHHGPLLFVRWPASARFVGRKQNDSLTMTFARKRSVASPLLGIFLVVRETD